MPVANHNHVTEGHLVRSILRLAVPMLISALLQNAQNLIDLYWIGRLGADAVAALAIGGTVLMMLFPLVMGMAVGTVAIGRAVSARAITPAPPRPPGRP